MEPILPVGSVVFTIPKSNYSIEDIITFKRGDKMITHRIFKNLNGKFIVKGDANKVADSLPVFKSDIVGKDIITIPYLGKFVAFIKTIPGFILIIGLPIIIYIAFEIRNIKKELEIAIEKKVLDKHKLAQEHE
jgi:signal peptidase